VIHFIETHRLELVLMLLVVVVILLATMPGKRNGDANQSHHRATGWRVVMVLLAIAATGLMGQYTYEEYITSEPVLTASEVPNWLIVGLFAVSVVPVYLGFRYKSEGWSTGIGFLIASLAVILVATSTAHMQYGGKAWTILWYATGVAFFSANAVGFVMLIAAGVGTMRRGPE